MRPYAASTRAGVVAALAHGAHLAQGLELASRLLKLVPRCVVASPIQDVLWMPECQCPVKFKRTGRHADGVIARGVATGLLNSVVCLGEVLSIHVVLIRVVGALQAFQDTVKVLKVFPGYATIRGDEDKGMTWGWHTIHKVFLRSVHVKVQEQTFFIHSNLLENVRKYLSILKQVEALFAAWRILDTGHHSVNHSEDAEAVRHRVRLGGIWKTRREM
jgi:hypothetical protein